MGFAYQAFAGNGIHTTVLGALPTLFPPRLTWLSAILSFVGGGPAVFNAMVFTMT